MLYHLLYPLHTKFSVLFVFKYITFRTIYATITALVISFLLGPWVIGRLQALQLGQTIRKLGPESLDEPERWAMTWRAYQRKRRAR